MKLERFFSIILVLINGELNIDTSNLGTNNNKQKNIYIYLILYNEFSLRSYNSDIHSRIFLYLYII